MGEHVKNYRIDFPNIDNLEYFPTELLLPIFGGLNDNELLYAALMSHRFKNIAKEVFKKKYEDKCFVIKRSSRQPTNYHEIFSTFGSSIRAVKINEIFSINKKKLDHSVVK